MAKNDGVPEQKGLTTSEALRILRTDIQGILQDYERSYKEQSWLFLLKEVFINTNDSPINWFPSVVTILIGIGLLTIGFTYSGMIVGTLFVLNMFVVLRENHLRVTEMHRKVGDVLDDIQLASQLSGHWTANNYPHLCSPLSPCVTLQWTYRDNEIINLPWALLVRGDNIVMRPGQVAPGECVEISGKRKFQCGETYGLANIVEPPPIRPIARSPLPDLVCTMDATPYLDTLKTSLNKFLQRPVPIYSQQRHLLITKCIQQWGLVCVILISTVGVVVHKQLIFTEEFLSWNFISGLIESVICCALPILPLVFPLIWSFVNIWNTAKLQTILSLFEAPTLTDQPKSFEEDDLDTPSVDWDHAPLPLDQVFYNWLAIVRGDNNELLGRSSNVVQVLGSITALCCVDKKGILSWPNPTAEKVFFLRDGTDEKSSQDSLDSGSSPNKTGTIAEVLDLTHDQHSPFKLDFDDLEWKMHIDSLKPLGLAILVNTCCPLTHAHYAQFCGHVTAVAMSDKDLVPVTNRYAIVESSLNSFMHGRCLCELAKQIGFSPQARDIFDLDGQIASYRHLQPDVVRRDMKFARLLQLASKMKVPFPHSLSVVMREISSGSLQLLTQGTADMVLDCCDDFWDGQDLRPLGVQERKRAQDFYQRSALTAYCTAFAYRPLRQGIQGSLAGKTDYVAYLELPPESKYRTEPQNRSPLNLGVKMMTSSISADSLLFPDAEKPELSEVERCFDMQCHQVFIGMVTMQYQAQTDIVQLIERLERACIRFVHFSKENELRSRVFSEKMGLESGWNCHISLLSEESSILSNKKLKKPVLNVNDFLHIEQEMELSHLLPQSGIESSKALSLSAPGAIFNTDLEIRSSTKDTDNSQFKLEPPSQNSSGDILPPDDTIYHSLSCLTDSTEQSVPIHFDMSNRAKLPRGIENIQPHLQNVDNVPLLVSLFTDCSADATQKMLNIMQSYGEIVVCLGSSASNANAEIFLQADCSIAIEPLYPQICQDFPAFTEQNLTDNRLSLMEQQKKMKRYFEPIVSSRNNTISPIFLSRKLNAISCSISVCRDDSLSIVGLIKLSRRLTFGLWNCIQFWACCGCTIALMNLLCACLAWPPMLQPIALLYLMCFAVPLMAVALVKISSDGRIMNRATKKKQTEIHSNALVFVIWCYFTKFLVPIIVLCLSHWTLLNRPLEILQHDNDNALDLEISRSFNLLAIVLHFVVISISFVHRDYLIWQKNPFTNRFWLTVCVALILSHITFTLIYLLETEPLKERSETVWPVILFATISIIITFFVTEFCKWQEIKANSRYQRRARLDFGTKLGMNSPF